MFRKSSFGPRSWVFLASCALVALGASSADAQEWTRFRGPNGAGASEADTIPDHWTDADYRFNVELPGVGHSSPVIWGNRVFLTSALEESATRIVLCLSAEDGKTLWKKEFDSSVHPKHDFNSFASATPVVDEERVYFLWSSPSEYTLLALDHEGNDAWRRDLGPYVSQHSCGASPVIYHDLVIVANDQGDEQHGGVSSLIAVDRKTGEKRWETPRKTEVVAYSTPCVYTPAGGADELIFNSGAHGITSVDPESGNINWELDALDKRSVSSPVIASGFIFGSTGSGKGGNYAVAIKPKDAREGHEAEVAYRVENSAPYVPSVVAKDDLVFMWSDAGVVSCLRGATGKEVWRERVGGNYHGSPVRVRDRLYCVADDGTVVVLAAGEEFRRIDKIPLGEECRSTPAVANGRMYLRTVSRLFAIGGS